MTVEDIFKYLKDGREELELNQKHGALLMIGAGKNLSSFVRGVGHNIIVAIVLSMKRDKELAELLKASVRLYGKDDAMQNDDEFSKMRKVLKEFDLLTPPKEE